MRILNSVTVPKNVEGGPFLPSILLQNIEQMKGPFGAIQKFSNV